MVVLAPCKNEKDSIKMKALECYQLFRHSKAANSTVSGGIQPKFELIQAFMVVLVICKNEEDPIKTRRR